MEKLKVNNLSFYYDKFQALKEISFTLSGSGFVSLVGPNGSGKSTLLKCLTGLMKIRENAVFINGKDIVHTTPPELAEHISYVPQITGQITGFTVREVVEMGRHPYKNSSKNKEMVDLALEITNTTRFMNKDCSGLSGGEFQRVIIARAIAQDTGIMILDEPVSHLDIHYQVEIIKTLRRLGNEKDMLIVSSMHDLNLAILFSSKVILLNEGEIFASGTPENILNEENIKKVYKTNISSVKIKNNSSLIFPDID